MNIKSIYILILSISVSAAIGCGGPAERQGNTGQTTTSNANSDRANNGSVEPARSDPDAGASAANRKRQVVEHASNGAPPVLQFQPAAENSEIAVTMRPDGSIYEVRVFKSHPRLSKVEVVWHGIGERSLKIFLRDGSVIEKKTDRLQDLQAAPTELLLEIAGLTSDPSPAGQTGEKKKRQ